MAILFASNEDIDFVQLAGTLDTSPASVGFDTNYVRSVFTAPASSPAGWRHVFDDPLTDFYHQFRWRTANGLNAVSVETILYYDPANSRPILRLINLSTGMTLQYWSGAAWTSVGTGLSLSANSHYVFTVRCKIAASGGIFEFLVGGATQASVTGDTEALLGGAYSVQWATWTGYPSVDFNAATRWAEVILTTGDESPVGMRVRTHTLTANGTNTGWSGAYSDVDEVTASTADVVSSDTANQVSTYALDDLPVALGTNVVRGVMVTAYTRCGATGPQNLQLSLQTNGGTHSSPTQALTTGYQPIRYMFEGNPATAAEFTAVEIDALEAGVTSVT